MLTKPTLLSIGVTGIGSRSKVLDIYEASTIREAIATIRLICIDLLVVGLDNSRLDVWTLVERVLAAWPHQRWLLASKYVTAEEEVHARSLGALMVLGDVPDENWLEDFAASLRRRDLSRHIPGLLSTGVADGAERVPLPAETI